MARCRLGRNSNIVRQRRNFNRQDLLDQKKKARMSTDYRQGEIPKRHWTGRGRKGVRYFTNLFGSSGIDKGPPL